MRKCKYYEQREEKYYFTEKEKAVKYIFDTMFNKIPDFSKDWEMRKVGRCTGQKNCPQCDCNGDKTKCFV